nr:Atxe2 family lasso peptide isopeptidase [uncultured Sphingomonas sp.]
MVKGAFPALLLAALLAAVPARADDCRERLTAPPGLPPAASRDIRAEDLIELRDFGIAVDLPGGLPAYAISPDGRALALILRRADVARNRYCLGVLLVPLDGGKPRLLDTGGEPTLIRRDIYGIDQGTGAFDALRPEWSPDGRWIAYPRRTDGVTQLWRVSVAGGDAVQLTREAGDVGAFAWGAGGDRLVYRSLAGMAARRARIVEEGRRGFLYDRRFWALASEMPQVDAGSSWITRVVEPARGAVREATPEERILVEKKPEPNLPPGAGSSVPGPDGALAWLAGDPGIFSGPMPLAMWVGRQSYRCVAPACAEGVIGMWWRGRDELVFLRDWGAGRAGMLEFFRWRPGRRPEPLFRPQGLLNGCTLERDFLLCGRETATQPRQLVRLSLKGAITILYDPSPEFRAVRTGAVRRITASAADGTPAFADFVLPPGHKSGDRHPLVIVQYYSRGFLRGATGDEYPIHLLAARGYAVLSFHRTRNVAYGSGARSLVEYQKRNVAGWADRRRVASALGRLVDAAVATGTVDPERIGISGMSDATATVQWMLLHDSRYRAAIVSSCCDDPAMAGYLVGPAFAEATKGFGYPPAGSDDAAFWQEYSLARGARRVSAPLLIQMADREYRTALETEAALRNAGKAVEMYVYPDEYHNKWQPAHRRAIYERVVDWFDFWLRGREDPAPEKVAQYARWRAMRGASGPDPQPGLDAGKP